MLFSDPWPKKRHHKRRLIDAETLDAFARILKDDAEFRWASDDRGYVEWTLERVARNKAFALTDRISGVWPSRPADWPETRYEQKARAQGDALLSSCAMSAARADGHSLGAISRHSMMRVAGEKHLEEHGHKAR